MSILIMINFCHPSPQELEPSAAYELEHSVFG